MVCTSAEPGIHVRQFSCIHVCPQTTPAAMVGTVVVQFVFRQATVVRVCACSDSVDYIFLAE